MEGSGRVEHVERVDYNAEKHKEAREVGARWGWMRKCLLIMKWNFTFCLIAVGKGRLAVEQRSIY